MVIAIVVSDFSLVHSHESSGSNDDSSGPAHGDSEKGGSRHGIEFEHKNKFELN